MVQLVRSNAANIILIRCDLELLIGFSERGVFGQATSYFYAKLGDYSIKGLCHLLKFSHDICYITQLGVYMNSSVITRPVGLLGGVLFSVVSLEYEILSNPWSYCTSTGRLGAR